ncbi:MAG: hypothetical protein LQ352_006500 [Teloschistes flavicans]|nr:MAG: hypothetical protein LQ352_006500 [Teloschistes flavicans]
MSTTDITTSQPASTAETSAAQKPKSHACVSCQRRKIKCDRRDPCANCIKFRIDCIFRAPAPPRRRPRKSPEAALLARLRRYEELLKGVGVNFEPENEAELAGQMQNVELDQTGVSATPESSDGTSLKTPQYQAEATVVDGEVVVKNGKFMEASDILPVSSEDEDYDGEPQFSMTVMDPHGGDLLLGDPVHGLELRSQHPGPDQGLRLWQAFLDNVNPLTKIIHAPTTQEIMLRATRNPNELSSATEALMLAIYSSAFSMYHRYDSHSLWTLTGVAIRIAQRMGLHRDGADLKLPPLETEIRRRLWWQILLLEVRAAEFSGIGQTIRELQWTTKIPLNVNDRDLNPSMVGPPAEHNGPTEMIYCMIRFEVGNVMKTARCKSSVDGSLQPIHSSEVPVQEKEKFIRGVEELLEQKYLRYCDPSIPLHFVTALMARSYACKLRFRSYHPRHYWARSNPVSQEEKDLLFSICVKILEYDNIVENTSTAQRYLWYIRSHFQFDALIHVLGELRSRSASDEINKAWQQVDEAFEHHPEILTDTRKGLRVAMTRLAVRAWDEYKRSCLQDQRLLYEIQSPLFRNVLASRDSTSSLDPPVQRLNIQALDQEATAPAGSMSNMLDQPLELNGPPMDSTPMDWSAWDDLLQDFELNPIGSPFE